MPLYDSMKEKQKGKRGRGTAVAVGVHVQSCVATVVCGFGLTRRAASPMLIKVRSSRLGDDHISGLESWRQLYGTQNMKANCYGIDA